MRERTWKSQREMKRLSFHAGQSSLFSLLSSSLSFSLVPSALSLVLIKTDGDKKDNLLLSTRHFFGQEINNGKRFQFN